MASSSTRPQRDRKKRIIWEAAIDDNLSSETLCVQKSSRTVKSEALKAIPTEIPHISQQSTSINANDNINTRTKRQIEKKLRDFQPVYTHKCKVAEFKRADSELATLRLFLTDEILDIIVQNTNSYAANCRE
jgi:hypothetical protein